MNNYAGLVRQMGKLSEAEELLREALSGLKEQVGELHPDTLKTIHNLASLLMDSQCFDEAEELFKEVLEGRRQNLGDWHAETLASARRLADVQRARAKLAKDIEGMAALADQNYIVACAENCNTMACEARSVENSMDQCIPLLKWDNSSNTAGQSEPQEAFTLKLCDRPLNVKNGSKPNSTVIERRL